MSSLKRILTIRPAPHVAKSWFPRVAAGVSRHLATSADIKLSTVMILLSKQLLGNPTTQKIQPILPAKMPVSNTGVKGISCTAKAVITAVPKISGREPPTAPTLRPRVLTPRDHFVHRGGERRRDYASQCVNFQQLGKL